MCGVGSPLLMLVIPYICISWSDSVEDQIAIPTLSFLITGNLIRWIIENSSFTKSILIQSRFGASSSLMVAKVGIVLEINNCCYCQYGQLDDCISWFSLVSAIKNLNDIMIYVNHDTHARRCRVKVTLVLSVLSGTIACSPRRSLIPM